MMANTKILAIVCLSGLLGIRAGAQSETSEPATQNLPQAPTPAANGTPAQVKSQTSPAAAGNQNPLTLKQAEDLAIKNNPQVSVARLTALAAQQVTREARSSLWPTATGSLTAVDPRDGSRITAGGLNNPIIYQRAAAGVMVSQLITDFGRTNNLASSANFAAKAQAQNAVATKEQILLAVDQAFYQALQAQAVLRVANQTVSARQTVADQINALFQSKLKSELDASFANVNLAQAKLLLLDADNNRSAALATLSMVLGYSATHDFNLIEDTATANQPPANVDDLIAQALTSRPEILSLDYDYQSAQKFHSAEKDLFFPDVRALGVLGDTPVRNPVLSNWYGAVGVNVDIPIFNGFLYSARSKESDLRAQAARDRLTDLRNRIARDVRTSWLNANTAYQRLSVTQQLLDQANLALSLAQTRYNLGLSSIVELSQAQLQQTQAEITNAQAGYDYRFASTELRYQTTGI